MIYNQRDHKKNKYDNIYLEKTRSVWDHTQWAVLKDQIQLSGKILDVGCGNGLISNQIVDFHSPTVDFTGLDISKSMIQKATRDYKNATWIIGDALRLKLPNNRMDITFCVNLLCELDSRKGKPLEAVKEMCRVTKSGGKVFFVEPAQGFAAGSRTMEIRDYDDHLNKDAFWSQIRFNYLKGYLEAHGCDYHIGVRLPGFFEEVGVQNMWVRGMIHVIPGCHYSQKPEFFYELLTEQIKPSWYPSPFSLLLKIGGTRKNIRKKAVKEHKKNWNEILDSLKALMKDQDDKEARNILSRLIIMIPMLAVGAQII